MHNQLVIEDQLPSMQASKVLSEEQLAAMATKGGVEKVRAKTYRV
jgi:hypothetical protein